MKRLNNLNGINLSTHIIIFSCFIFHLFFINFPSVNLEEIFSFGSENFRKTDISIYFKYQENTLGFSYLIYFFNLMLDYNALAVGKIISAISYLLIGYGIVNLKKNYFKEYPVNNLIILIFLHPLVWNFGFRSTPDLISASIGFFGLTLILPSNENFLKSLIGSVLIGIAITLKPHSIIFLILYVVYFFLKKNYRIFFFISLIIIIILPIIFYIVNFIIYDFFLINDNFQSESKISFKNFFHNIFQFLGFIAIIFFPLSAYSLINYYNHKKFKNLFYIFLFSSIFFTIGFLFLDITGEMDFGTLGQFINKNFYTGLLMAVAPTLLVTTIYLLKKKDVNKTLFLSILISILIYIFLLSLAKPTQRYLISLVPLIFIFSNYLLLKSFIKNTFIIIFIFVNILIFNNQYASGFLSQDAINFIKKNDLYFDDHDRNYGPLGFHRPVFVEKNKTDMSKKTIYISEIKSENSIFFKCRSLLPIINKCISINKN